MLDALKQRLDIETIISHDVAAAIVPFAQKETVQTFMEGIDPDLGDAILEAVDGLLKEYDKYISTQLGTMAVADKERISKAIRANSQRLLGVFSQNLKQVVRSSHVDPVLDVVEMLPKPELASMAESLTAEPSKPRRARHAEP